MCYPLLTMMIRSPGTKAMAPQTPALPLELSLRPQMARSVYAADIDNDGDMDVLSASTNDDKIVWYENGLSAFGDPTFGSATITTSADGANLSTPQISIAMAIWMSSPHHQAMIRSPGTKTMAPQIPVLPLAPLLRPLIWPPMSTLQILIMTAIWMCFLPQL